MSKQDSHRATSAAQFCNHSEVLDGVVSTYVEHYKELMKLVDELRRLDGASGSIAVSESEYMASILL
jgi:hypothetical protein